MSSRFVFDIAIFVLINSLITKQLTDNINKKTCLEKINNHGWSQAVSKELEI